MAVHDPLLTLRAHDRKRDSPMDNDEDAEVERRGFVGLESELD